MRIREIYLPIPAEKPTLGLSLQWTPLNAAEDIWHILDVIPNSPADVAGLLPYGDYVIGSPDGVVHGESGLGELVEDVSIIHYYYHCALLSPLYIYISPLQDRFFLFFEHQMRSLMR